MCSYGSSFLCSRPSVHLMAEQMWALSQNFNPCRHLKDNLKCNNTITEWMGRRGNGIWANGSMKSVLRSQKKKNHHKCYQVLTSFCL